jgi:acetyl-CoA carboxylase biotin carboxyl carrier protein
VTLTAQDVADITRLLEESSFDELYLELDGLKLTLRRQGAGGTPAAPATPQPASQSTADPTPGAVLPSPPSGPAPAASPAAPQGTVQNVVAPLLGTFYRAPKPGSAPFVETGSQVKEDTVIGIIEVMKLMNAVRAGVCGVVAEILAQDGVLVEYGEVLLRIDTTGQT